GVDIEHEDLKDNIWINEGEIPGNGIDDDNNGYIDDVYGWNFIGGKDGRNVDADTYEVTREYVRLRPIYENIDESKIKKKQRAKFEYWKTVKDKYERDSRFSQEQLDQYLQYYELYANAYSTIPYYDSILQVAIGAP